MQFFVNKMYQQYDGHINDLRQLMSFGINIKCIYVSLIYKFVVLLCYITYVTMLCYTVNKVVFEFEFCHNMEPSWI